MTLGRSARESMLAPSLSDALHDVLSAVIRCLSSSELRCNSALLMRTLGVLRGLLARRQAGLKTPSHARALASWLSLAQQNGRQGEQEQHRWWQAAGAATATAAGATALLWPSGAACQQQQLGTPTGASGRSSSTSSSWFPGWLSRLWGGGRHEEENQFLLAIKEDPRVAVVLSYALPSLSLSFGFSPQKADMDRAATLVEPSLGQLRPWELAVLLWGAARLGYHPAQSIMEEVKRQLAAALSSPPAAPGALSPQEAAMAGWALAAMGELNPEFWADVNSFISGCPAETLDEVALIHLFQAALFADRAFVTAPSHPSAPGVAGTPAAAHLPHLRSATDEVRATLAAGGLPLPLINRCEQVYKAAAEQPGFDGPSLIELSMVRLLVRIYQEGGGSGADGAAYQSFFHDFGLMDVQRARQLMEDPYLLTKFKREIANKRSRQNNFTRQLADISRTLTALGVYHVTQAAVEDGLVHVDIALPDYKIAFFLEGAENIGAIGGSGGKGGGGRSGLTSLDSDGVVLSGYLANETPGSKAAKLRLLERLGWQVFPITWVESIKDEGAKRAAILAIIDRAGRDALMRGRVSSALHGALRAAEESKLGTDRFQRASAGQYTTLTRPQ